NGTIINPGGTLSVPLADGNYTITLLGDGGSGSTTAQRILRLGFNGKGIWDLPDIEITTTGPSSASFVSGATTITVNNLTYVDGDISGFDRIATCDIFQDGYTDTIATFDMVVSTILPDDGDGVPNAQDACPHSDLSPTVSIDGCNSGVSNSVFASGCTISDFV